MLGTFMLEFLLVCREGFEYYGERFKTPSVVTMHIAGTPWNRVLFFRLTTMGIEHECSSLDAQCRFGLAYIYRQPGWQLEDKRYDGGGFTGANADRPTFTRLLADCEAGTLDVIVVYRADRLSRSLLDFTKMMERFTAADLSFVFVTQNVSAADVMGRLTLNMYMSFAEFERSLIAERQRDKTAALRREGKWTAGPVPFGLGDRQEAPRERGRGAGHPRGLHAVPPVPADGDGRAHAHRVRAVAKRVEPPAEGRAALDVGRPLACSGARSRRAP